MCEHFDTKTERRKAAAASYKSADCVHKTKRESKRADVNGGEEEERK